jgi:lipopolysaccharide transport system ATP-binding protein
MSDTVIRVENLSKKYILGHQKQEQHTTLRDAISSTAKGLLKPFQRDKSQIEKLTDAGSEEFWALKDVSFEISQGDRVGIIGRNGAGKSTLLKILSRITEPTKGSIRVKGRVASLLEVGTGFHPELTGRENISLNGAILGMSKTDINRKFDEIVAFAEVEKFLDTPVKRYSSGMYVRLAFAVAAHLEPEILIVDEVLAVGDAQFQKKCLGKMEEVGREGRTVLFVSHNMQAISTLTQKCILLSHGTTIFQGKTESAIEKYLQDNIAKNPIYQGVASDKTPKITRIELRTSLENNVQVNSDPIEVVFEISTPIKLRGACLSFQFVDSLQQPYLHVWTFDSERPMCREPGIFQVVCKIPKLRLYMGSYTVNAYFSEPPGGEIFEILEQVCPFEVVMYGNHREFEWKPGSCAYLEEFEWDIQGSVSKISA